MNSNRLTHLIKVVVKVGKYSALRTDTKIIQPFTGGLIDTKKEGKYRKEAKKEETGIKTTTKTSKKRKEKRQTNHYLQVYHELLSVNNEVFSIFLAIISLRPKENR